MSTRGIVTRLIHFIGKRRQMGASVESGIVPRNRTP
jgi:hypothetical protein